MADLPESNEWPEGIYQLETSDPVLGGPEGIDNLQAKQLASRTKWLKDQIGKIIEGVNSVGRAAKLETARALNFKGAATGSGNFDGSADTEITLTLADVPWEKITGGKPTTLAGYGIDIPTQAEAEAQSAQDNTKPMTALRVFQAIAKRVVQATESVFGWAKVATQAQTNSGVDDTTIVTPKKFSAGVAALVIQATEAVKGIAKIATTAQVNAGAGDDVMVTPYKMRLGFTVSFNAQGYVVFPSWLGSLIIQWTNSSSIAPAATGAAYWPIAFPVGCIWALAAPLGNGGNGNAGNVVAGGVSPVAVNLYNWGGSINSPARVIGIGV